MSKNSDKANRLKKNLIEALEKTLGIVTTACKICGCNRDTYYTYYKQDEKFREAVDEIENLTLDFVESKLHKLIEGGDTAATIFYLKTKGKKRGYVERAEVLINKIGLDKFEESYE